jgi:class 3 adenylate cyclase
MIGLTGSTGTITFLLTDIEGSTRSWERARPRYARRSSATTLLARIIGARRQRC